MLAEFFAENFDGNLAVEFVVFGEIDFSHSARADLPDDFIVTETHPTLEFSVRFNNETGDFFGGGLFHKTFRVFK